MTDISRTYKRAYGVYLESAITQIIFLDIATMPLRNISTYFQKLSVVVFDHYYQKELSIDLFRYLNEMVDNDSTIQQWLDTKNHTVLTTSEFIPKITLINASYSDITYRNFKLYPGDVRKSQGDQNLLTVSKAVDIRVIKNDVEKVDYRVLKNKTLWSINGHLVRAVADDHCLYLLGAGRHYKVDDNIHVGCINFNLISDVNTVPITTSDLSLDVSGENPKIHISLPADSAGKKVWLSLAGRLLFEGTVKRTGDTVLSVDLTRYDLVNRIFRSQDFIDLGDIIGDKRTVIPKDYYRNEAVLTALFTHISSFLIIFDNPHINVTREKLVRYNHPYTYFTSEKEKLPMVLANGLIPKYFIRKYRHDRLLDIDLGAVTKFINDTTGLGYGDLFYKQVSSAEPSSPVNAYLLKIQAIVVSNS